MSRRAWIISPFWDATLFIASPLLVIAAFVPLRAWVRSEQLSLWLLAFFTFGHHLPGFLRAYGDRELFARFRWRFLLAPPLVLAVSLWTDQRNLHGLLFLVFAWDIWHVLRQQYGFLRIYDAKLGVTDGRTARLDHALTLSWYITLIVMSPHYRHDLLLRLFSSGVPIFSPAALSAAETVLLAFSGALTLLYVLHHRRRPFNWRKLAALGSFLFATWYLYVALDDFIAGFAIWSAFHCLQYFGIVWAFHQKRRDQPGALAAWMRMLFRPRPALALCYLGLIFAYGGINYAARLLEGGAVSRLLMCLVISSGALHYYYDAFIWKIREPATARTLRLPVMAGVLRSPGLAQAALFGVALGVLSLLEIRRPNTEVNVLEALTRLSPEAAVSHLNWGNVLRRQGRLGDAEKTFARAAELEPRMPLSRYQLGLALAAQGKDLQAADAFRQAHEVDPSLTEARKNAAMLWTKGGIEAVRAGDTGTAFALFRRAAEWDPDSVDARINFGNLLMMRGDYRNAESEFRAALALQPDHGLAHHNLALLLARLGREAEARQHRRITLEGRAP
jgi:Flp pilus assembly protein TadD